jgi:hypothetical protein
MEFARASGVYSQAAMLPYAIISRHFDATPMTFEFGELHDALRHDARYRVLCGGRPYIVDSETAKAYRRHLKSGILDVLGQTVMLQWPSDTGDRCETLLTRFPVILAVGTAFPLVS